MPKETLAAQRMRIYYGSQLRESMEQFYQTGNIQDIMFLSDLMFMFVDHPTDDPDRLHDRILSRFGFGYQGPHGPNVEDVCERIPDDAMYYQIESVKGRGGVEDSAETIVMDITREEVEELIYFLASMRWLGRGSRPDPEGWKRHQAAITGKFAPAEPEGDAANA